MVWVTHQTTSEEVNKSLPVGVVIQTGQALFVKQFFSRVGDLDIKIDPVWPVEEKLTCDDLIEQTSQ